MKQAENTAMIYRICAVNEEQWDVLRSSSKEPVASFTDKHAAVAYAMSLARDGASWHVSTQRGQEVLRTLFHPRGTRGTGH